MKKVIKKRWLPLLFILCILMTGCSSEFAKNEYDANDKIAKKEDHYTKTYSVFNTLNESCTLTIAKFNGRQTLWSKLLPDDKTITMNISFCLLKGRAKLVHIDKDDNVTTIIECSPDMPTDGFVSKEISLKSGRNRLKIVGYDCEELELEMEYDPIL